MTSEIFLLNTFFAYFFNTGEHLLAVFSLALVGVFVASFIRWFLTNN